MCGRDSMGKGFYVDVVLLFSRVAWSKRGLVKYLKEAAEH
jgi:hypothetical protein